MAHLCFQFHGQAFVARASGALYWPAQETLLVADLHLGKSERMARRGGALLPPFDTQATLARLQTELTACGARRLIALGDSFDDDAAARGLPEGLAGRPGGLAGLAARAALVWITGNHDPAPDNLPGAVCDEMHLGGLALRHIAAQGPDISGHYHPCLRILGQRRPAFLIGATHLIVPAFGQYTGGLDWQAASLQALVPEGAAILTGTRAQMVPLPLPVRSPGGERRKGALAPPHQPLKGAGFTP
ncbi:MAG: ligase-associated DNA damage response endonuclease PdeM [Roseinatronobacter sp.]